MLAENLVDSHNPVQQSPVQEHLSIQYKEADENNAEEISEFNIGKDNAVINQYFLVTVQKFHVSLLEIFSNTFLQSLSLMLQTLMKILMCSVKMNQ